MNSTKKNTVNAQAFLLQSRQTFYTKVGRKFFSMLVGVRFFDLCCDQTSFFDSFVGRIDYSCVRLEMDVFGLDMPVRIR